MSDLIQINDQFDLTDIRPTDAVSLVKYLNDFSIHDVTLTIPFPYTDSDAATYLDLTEKNMEKFKSRVNWAIRERSTGEMVGSIGRFGNNVGSKFKPHVDEIGYWLAASYRRRGLMTAAIKAYTKHLFSTTELTRLEAIIFAKNAASGRALEKSGFQREGYLRQAEMKNGETRDLILCALLKNG